MSNGTATPNGLSFGSVLFFVFLIMKLTNYIDWSWWWVTAPLWMPITVILGLLAFGGFCWGIFAVIAGILNKGTK